MPDIETDLLFQKALVWAPTGKKVTGEITVSHTPVEIDCRWIDTYREALSPDGQKIVLEATVIVAQDIAIGSIMWLGTEIDWFGTGSTSDNTRLMQVIYFKKTPDVDNMVYRRRAMLMRWRNSLPPES